MCKVLHVIHHQSWATDIFRINPNGSFAPQFWEGWIIIKCSWNKCTHNSTSLLYLFLIFFLKGCKEGVTESLTCLIIGFLVSYCIWWQNFQLCISTGYRENMSLIFTAEIGIPTYCWCHTSQIVGDCKGNLCERVNAISLYYMFLMCETNRLTISFYWALTKFTKPYRLFYINCHWAQYETMTWDITNLVGISWVWKWTGSERGFTKINYSLRSCPRVLKIGHNM